MKKLITLMIFVIIATATQAQFKKGTYLVSGSSQLSFTSNEVKMEGEKESGKLKTSSITASAGYLYKNNLAFGGALAMASITADIGGVSTKVPTAGKGGESEDSKMSINSLHAYARYYFLGGKRARIKKFLPYVQGIIGYSMAKMGSDDSGKFSGLSYGGVVGASYFLNKNVGIEAGANYTMVKMKNSKHSNQKFDLSTLNLMVGLVVTLDF